MPIDAAEIVRYFHFGSLYPVVIKKLVVENFDAFTSANDETDKRYSEWHETNSQRWRIFYYMNLSLLRFDLEFENPSSALGWSLEIEWTIRFCTPNRDGMSIEGPVKERFSSDDPRRNLIWIPTSEVKEHGYVYNDTLTVRFDMKFVPTKADVDLVQVVKQLEVLQCAQKTFASKVFERLSRMEGQMNEIVSLMRENSINSSNNQQVSSCRENSFGKVRSGEQEIKNGSVTETHQQDTNQKTVVRPFWRLKDRTNQFI